MKLRYFLILLIIIIPIFAILTFILYQNYVIVEVQTIESHIIIMNGYGFNIDNSKLYLGGVPPGGIAFRNFTVNNTGTEGRNIEIKEFGELKDWSRIYPSNFYLGPGESQPVKYYVQTPGRVSFGNHTGRINIYFKRPLT